MLRDSLQIQLITFNRAESLRATLESLLAGPFADCTVTVLDNRSTDSTPQVCGEFEGRFRDMRVVRHRHNLGGGPNYLRAVELATAPYTWVLADDDDLSWADCDDVIEAIVSGRPDLVSVGGPGRERWPRGELLGARELAAQHGRFFHVFTFIPNTILRTELFDDGAMSDGYRLVGTLYPQLPFLIRQWERDARVYVSRGDVVIRRGMTTPSSGLYWMRRMIDSLSTIDDRRMRRQAVYEICADRSQWRRMLALVVAQEKLDHPRRVWPELCGLLAALEGEQRLWAALVAPLALVPARVYAVVRRALRLMRRQPPHGPPDEGLHDLAQRP